MSTLKQRSIGFREDQYKFCSDNSIDLPDLLRKLLDTYIEQRKTEQKKVANYNNHKHE